MRLRPTHDRLSARWEIIRAANKYKRALLSYYGWPADLYGMRQLQKAVCVVRRNRLVKPEVLVAAGFRP